jgi:hypothetical protein
MSSAVQAGGFSPRMYLNNISGQVANLLYNIEFNQPAQTLLVLML